MQSSKRFVTILALSLLALFFLSMLLAHFYGIFGLDRYSLIVKISIAVFAVFQAALFGHYVAKSKGAIVAAVLFGILGVVYIGL